MRWSSWPERAGGRWHTSGWPSRTRDREHRAATTARASRTSFSSTPPASTSSSVSSRPPTPSWRTSNAHGATASPRPGPTTTCGGPATGATSWPTSQMARPPSPSPRKEQSMGDPDAVLGVVAPSTSAYDSAIDFVNDSLVKTKQRLADLRKQREGINDEIRDLVADEELLERMARVARKEAKA